MSESGQRLAVVLCAGAPATWGARAIARSLVAHSAATVAENVCLVVGGSSCDLVAMRQRYPLALHVVTGRDAIGADLFLPADANESVCDHVIDHAVALFRLHDRHVLDLAAQQRRVQQLSEIGRALATERDPARLLDRILSEGRRLSNCEAGSLYLIAAEDVTPQLIFKLVQNDVVKPSFEEQRLHLTPTSLAGYVAVTGEELNIEDAYQIGSDRPYRFNAEFDVRSRFRSQSILVLPMRDHRGEVVGVLQFINRRVDGVVVPFEEEIADLLRAVGSQAAIAIQKNKLISDIRELFEQFVQASVKAIEQRDPTTSGHSFRVAESTTALFEALPRAGLARFKDLQITPQALTELRYAALLHDFGKVGVRESVLVKSHKLADGRLDLLEHRFELAKERARSRALSEELELLHAGVADFPARKHDIRTRMAAELARLDRFFALLVEANDPQTVPSRASRWLERLADVRFTEFDGSEGALIDARDLEALSITRGSLTVAERQEIQRHVEFTRDFLAVLPWPPELSRVPLIASAHHEKLDGSGYPLGLAGDQIPLPSRVMTVCDIFDALTAMDRPYKPALSVDAALGILEEETRAGMLDRDVVNVFIDSTLYRDAGARVAQRQS